MDRNILVRNDADHLPVLLGLIVCILRNWSAGVAIDWHSFIYPLPLAGLGWNIHALLKWTEMSPEGRLFPAATPASRRYSAGATGQPARYMPWTWRVLVQYRLLGLGVDLNPRAATVKHRKVALIVALHRAWERKQSLMGPIVVDQRKGALADHVRVGHKLLFAPLRQLAVTPECGYEPALWTQNLHAIILPVSDVYFTVVIYANTARPIELTNAAAGRSEGRQPLSIRRELLNTVVAPIGHVRIGVPVQANSPRQIELTRAATEPAELTQVSAIGRKLLHPVVAAVDQEQDIVT